MRRLFLVLALLTACGIAHAQSLNNPEINNYIAPTAPVTDNSARIATTAWVNIFLLKVSLSPKVRSSSATRATWQPGKRHRAIAR
jgi:hypothetical protein